MTPRGAFDLEDWRRKLEQQEKESRTYRHLLYDKVGLSRMGSVLDVGCGTGAVTRDIALSTRGDVVGIDIDAEKLEIARKNLSDLSNARVLKADAMDLPFEEGTFDLVVLNIVLVYIKDQQRAVDEMVRVLKKGGTLLASLEPDYEGDISYPPDEFRSVQLEAMRKIGGDTACGRKLKTLFKRAGLKVDVGIDTESDYIYIRDDRKLLEMFTDNFWALKKILADSGWSDDRIEGYRKEMCALMERGEAFRFACAFYAIGTKV